MTPQGLVVERRRLSGTQLLAYLCTQQINSSHSVTAAWQTRRLRETHRNVRPAAELHILRVWRWMKSASVGIRVFALYLHTWLQGGRGGRRCGTLFPPPGFLWMYQKWKKCSNCKQFWPPLWSSGQSSWLQNQRSRFYSRLYQFFWEVAGLERGPLSLVSTTEERLRSRKRRIQP
jgi:hypothetical protein